MRTKRPSDSDIDKLYVRWLKSESLRSIAASQPYIVSHSAIDVWFKKRYGKDATNVVKRSLHRSLLEDYPEGHREHEEVMKWVLANLHLDLNDKHRSHHSIAELSRNEVIHDARMMDYLAPSVPDYMTELMKPRLDFLRLPMLTCLVVSIYNELKSIYTYEQARRVETLAGAVKGVL